MKRGDAWGMCAVPLTAERLFQDITEPRVHRSIGPVLSQWPGDPATNVQGPIDPFWNSWHDTPRKISRNPGMRIRRIGII